MSNQVRATISDHTSPSGERVGLILHHEPAGHIWRTESGEDCQLGYWETEEEAATAAESAWRGDIIWD